MTRWSALLGNMREVGRRWLPAARLVLLVCSIWALLASFFALQTWSNAHARGRMTPLSWALEDSLRRYAIYALLTFPILWICRRFEPDARGWVTTLMAHAAACLGCNLTYAALRSLSAVDVETLKPVPISLDVFFSLARRNLFEVSWMYASIVFVALTLQYQRRSREREVRESELRRQMAEYELQILRLQLHPHFLFNTLNGIATLMGRDVRTAREMLLRLGDLLRFALARSREDEIPLRDEVDFVRAYLDLERMRLGERLSVRLGIEPSALEARVPNMIVQPLVENAIRHGIEPLRQGGTIELAVRRVNGALSIRVINDGPPLGACSTLAAGHGVGLRSVRSRLAQLYGDACRLRLESRPEGGMDVGFEIPVRGAVP